MPTRRQVEQVESKICPGGDATDADLSLNEKNLEGSAQICMSLDNSKWNLPLEA